MPQRIARAANRHPFLTSVIFTTIIFIVGSTAYRVQSKHTIDRVAAEATERRTELAAKLAESQKDVCERAIIAVTSQLNADLLKVIKTIEDRIVEQGRAVPPIYIQLENVISNRQPPLEACVPKENP
jgi:hypothetical protein